MKHLLIVKNMECEKCVEKISEALSDAGIEYEINFQQKTVNILKRGDSVINAKRILSELGYIIA